MEAPLSLQRRPGLNEFSYESREATSTLDRYIVIGTASLFGVLLLALFMLFFIQWGRKYLSMQAQGMKAAPPGMTKLQLDAFPCSVFPHAAHVASDCAICLADFALGDSIRVLPPCHHSFHVGCIDTWLLRQSSCPVCRASLILSTQEANGLFHTAAKIFATQMNFV